MSFSPGAIVTDRSSPIPLYFQVASELERAIENGLLKPGDQLDNEIMLAEQLGLSRPTVRRALEYLVDKGHLVRRRGIGTQVVLRQVRRPIELTSLYEDLESSGQAPTTQVVSLDTVPAPDWVARELDIPEASPVLDIRRLRLSRGEPLALMHNFVPVGLVALSAAELETQGLYPLLRAAGLELQLASQRVGARTATAAEARQLAERRGACVLTMHRITYDQKGRPIEVGDHLYRPTMYSFEFALAPR